jgi:type II secretory pathway component PulM
MADEKKANADLQKYVNAAKAEIDLVTATIRDKGAKRFGKAFGIAGAFVFLAYWFVYKPPQSKISRLAKEIEAASAMSASASQYKELRDQLAGSYGTLPLLKDQAQWLSNAMIDSLRADNLTPESFRPVTENESSGLIFQTSSVQMTLRFNDLYAWLLRLESARPLMHIGVLEVSKKTDLLGYNSVNCSVMTAIPKKRFN